MPRLTPNFPQERTVRLRDFGGGFTDWRCGCPPNYFLEIENFDVLFDKSICTRYGSRRWATCQIEERIQRLDCLKGQIYAFSGKNLYKATENGCELVEGCSKFNNPTNPLFPLSDEDTCSDSAYWQGHMYVTTDACDAPIKVYCDANDETVAVTAGLPSIGDANVVLAPQTPVAGGGSPDCNYIYAFYLCYEYTDNCGVTYLDNGPVTYKGVTDTECVGVGAGAGNEIVAAVTSGGLSNGTLFNYCTGDIRLKVYRTTDNGTTFYYIGDSSSGGSVSDTTTDAQLQLKEVIYNQNSTISNDAPPNAKYIEIVGEVAWYANAKIDGVKFTNRLYQSIPADPDAVPRDFYIEFDGEINGLSSYGDFPIVSVVTQEGKCDLYRIEGVLDEFGRNIIQQRKIGDQLSSINNNSFVQTRQGLYFFGTDGVYVTDGYKAQKVSEKWDETYCKITETELQKKRVNGAYDKKKNIIYWSVIDCAGQTRANRILVYNVKQSAFTWYSNEGCFTASSMIVKDNELYRGDEDGFLHIHQETLYTDDVFYDAETGLVDAISERKKAIEFCLRTTDIDMELCDINKWWNKVSFQSKPGTNQSFQIMDYFDGCSTPKELTSVTYEYGAGWCTSGANWCESGTEWCVVSECDMFKTRKFGCGRKRSKSRQLELKPKEQVLYCSEKGSGDTLTFFSDSVLGQGPTGNTFVLYGSSLTSSNIGDDLVICGKVIKILKEGLNGGQTGAVLEGNIFEITSGEKDFAIPYDGFTIQGKPKNERFCLNCITLTFCVMDDSGGEFMATEVTGKQPV